MYPILNEMRGSSHDGSCKRKYSGESKDDPDYTRSTAKRVLSQRPFAKRREDCDGSSGIRHGSPLPITQYIQSSLARELDNGATHHASKTGREYWMIDSAVRYHSGGYEGAQLHQSQLRPLLAQTNYSQNITGQLLTMPTYSPYSPAIQTCRSPGSAFIATRTRTPIMRSPAGLANPPLSNQDVQVPPHPAAFNPYSMYPNSKTTLKIEGDLEEMANNWSQEEWDSKRRLVQFQRSRTGSTITTSFKPVSLEQRSPNSICVSCILWEEKGECYITSVDMIHLLESLVAVRFTVEEKNRIRRNLEGFRPATVSKTKVDSEEFFKVIMGFSSPKARNIQKDVKVFPWKILAHALKKIISKHSASYLSTAGALESNDLQCNTSLRSQAGSSGSLAYTGLLLTDASSKRDESMPPVIPRYRSSCESVRNSPPSLQTRLVVYSALCMIACPIVLANGRLEGCAKLAQLGSGGVSAVSAFSRIALHDDEQLGKAAYYPVYGVWIGTFVPFVSLQAYHIREGNRGTYVLTCIIADALLVAIFSLSAMSILEITTMYAPLLSVAIAFIAYHYFPKRPSKKQSTKYPADDGEAGFPMLDRNVGSSDRLGGRQVSTEDDVNGTIQGVYEAPDRRDEPHQADGSEIPRPAPQEMLVEGQASTKNFANDVGQDLYAAPNHRDEPQEADGTPVPRPISQEMSS